MMDMKSEDKQEKFFVQDIASIPLFKSFDQAVLNNIAPYLERVVLNAGDYLLHRNDENEAIYFVVNGSLYARNIGGEGEETILGEIGAGDPVGEIHILTGGVHMADVIAREKTVLLKLRKSSLEILIDNHQPIADKIYEIAGNRLLKNHLADLLPHIFGPLDQTVIGDIQKQAQWIHLPCGEVLFREGDPGNSLYLVVMGRLRVVKHSNGKEKIIGEASRGECIGEMALLTSEPRSATVYAARDCELICISKDLFEKLLDTYPKVMTRIIRILVDRLKKTSCQSASAGKITNIAVVPVQANISARDFVNRFTGALELFGRVCHLDSSLIKKTFPAAKDGNASWNKTISIQLGTWLYEQEMKYPFVVYETDPSLTTWTLKCLSQADHIVFLAASDNDSEQQIDPRILKDITHVMRSMVILHPANNSPRGTSQLLREWNVDNHYHVRQESHDDFQRLARIFAGKAIGLVLGGGGARAFAHIGAIRALREHGIPVDMIGGTSMGAVIASGYALGWNEDKILETLKESFIKKNVFHDFTLPVISLLRCRDLDHAMQNTYGDTQIEDLWLNYFCTSSNLSMADLEVHRNDFLWKAVRASVSYPGIAVPVIKDGHLLVDGGVLNNLPVDIMREHCRGITIAIDVSQVEDLKVQRPRFPSPWTMLYKKIFKNGARQEFPGIVDILMRTAELASISQRKKTIEEADLYLHPPVQEYKLLDFEHLDALIDIGYQYTKIEIVRWEKEGLWDRCSL